MKLIWTQAGRWMTEDRAIMVLAACNIVNLITILMHYLMP